MAIQKLTKLENGVEGDYWRITQTNVDYVHNTIVVYLSLYLSIEQKDENPLCPITAVNIVMHDVDWISYEKGNRTYLYDRLQESSIDESGVESNWYVDAVRV